MEADVANTIAITQVRVDKTLIETIDKDTSLNSLHS